MYNLAPPVFELDGKGHFEMVKTRMWHTDMADLDPEVRLVLLREVRDRYASRGNLYPGILRDLDGALADYEERVSAQLPESVESAILGPLDLPAEERIALSSVDAA